MRSDKEKYEQAVRLIHDLLSVLHRPHWDQASDVVSIKNEAYKFLALYDLEQHEEQGDSTTNWGEA